MKKIIQGSLLSLLLMLGFAHAQTTLVPQEAFSIDDVKIGSTTLDDIQYEYGKAPIGRAGTEDGSAMQICYFHISSKGKTFVVFESGAMGGFKRVTAFRIANRYPSKNCLKTDVDLSKITSGNGIQLRQSRKNFLKNFSVNFKRVGENLLYESESKREATKEELDRLRLTMPNERQTFFDVLITIKARFKNGRLIDYYVSKVESY